MRAVRYPVGRSGRGVLQGIVLMAGLVLSAGPLLGTMVSVVQVLRVYAAAAARGEALVPAAVRFPVEPVFYGFAAFVPGILLLTFTVLGYSRRIKRSRMAGRQ